jgi:alpha/beta superfamily hydrolase
MRGITVEAEDGIEEEIGFIGPLSDSIFAVVTRPREQHGAVVICPSILTDILANYSAEVLLARRLVRLGVASVRFHYRGTGQSGGAQGMLDFSTMRADACEAVALAARALGVGENVEMALMGTRIGALVAVATARDLGIPRLVAWDPTLDAEAFFRQAIRMRFMREVVAGKRSKDTMKSLLGKLRAGQGDIDVLGYTVTPRLFASLVTEVFSDYLFQARCQALLIALGADETYLGELTDTAARAGGRGVAVTGAQVVSPTNWLLTGSQRDPEPWLIELTSRWLTGTSHADGT